jgi:tRNA (guanine-N7-)-methyltransferase
LTAGQKKHLEEDFPRFGISADDGLLDRLKIFPDKKKVILEIGFGNGEATVSFAKENPDYGYIGAEVHTPGVGRLLCRISEEGLANIRIWHGDVLAFLQTVVPDRFFDGVHIFFPDPWPKKKHNKRRLFSSSLLALLWNKTSSGAYVHFVTDWEDYAAWALNAAQSSGPFWTNPHQDYAPADSGRPQTAFESKGLKKNHKIKEIYLLRKDA